MSVGTVNTVLAVVSADSEPQVHTFRTAATRSGADRVGATSAGDFADLTGGVDGNPVDASTATRIAELTARLVSSVDIEAHAVLACPAVYSAAEMAALRRALKTAGRTDIALCPEPVAAATWFATRNGVGEDEVALVYDLGGAGLDIALVRIDAVGHRIRLIGRPVRSSGFGGRTFSSILARYVHDSSADTSSPGLAAELPSDDVEQLRAAHIRSSVPLVRECVHVAGLSERDVDRIVLVGGASRPSIVARVLADELGCPVVTVPDPAECVALGAAVLAAADSWRDDGADTPQFGRAWTRAAVAVGAACVAAVPILGGVAEPLVGTADRIAAETPAPQPGATAPTTASTATDVEQEPFPTPEATTMIVEAAGVQWDSQPAAAIFTRAVPQPAPEAEPPARFEPDSAVPEMDSATFDPPRPADSPLEADGPPRESATATDSDATKPSDGSDSSGNRQSSDASSTERGTADTDTGGAPADAATTNTGNSSGTAPSGPNATETTDNASPTASEPAADSPTAGEASSAAASANPHSGG